MQRFAHPFGEDRQRGHRHVGGPLGRGERERHYIVAGIIAAVAAAASAYAAYSAAEAQSQAANYNKKVARNQAQASRDAAAIARSNRQEELRRIMAAQRARIGASGVTEEGSPLLVEMESARQAQLDLARITYAGETRSQGYQSEGILQGFYASSYQRAAYIGAGTALLGGTASAYGAYNSGRQTQTPSSASGSAAP